jgi:pimeloyl-ACP methyl ester carboxylesterase
MKIKGISQFKNPAEASGFLEYWSARLQHLNNSFYERFSVHTSLGNTNVWAYKWQDTERETVVFFPGARTCGLFWDIDNALQLLKNKYRILIVDVNGHPNLSEGKNPYIKCDGYGVWATEVLEALHITKATVVGASLGGLICMKLCIASPHLADKAVLMNPAGIRSFSSSPKNLYYNFLPVLIPSEKNLEKFFSNVIFHKPQHTISQQYLELMNEYMLYVLKHFKFRGDYPTPLGVRELQKLQTPVYLVLGDKDLRFPCKETIEIANQHIGSLKKVSIVPNTAHGIETSKQAIGVLYDILNDHYTGRYDKVKESLNYKNENH